jgi:hypothetical protein
MQLPSSLPRHARSLLTALLLLVCASEVYGVDTYSAGKLTIPTVTIGNATYSNVAVAVADILSGPLSAAPYGSADSYNPVTNQLTVPSVMLGTTQFNNVVATVGSLVSIGVVAGADSYNLADSQLTIPYVQLGNTVYHNAVVTVSGIVSVIGGMPSAPWDSYSLANKQLSIPAVQVGGKVYSNATVTVGSILSLGASSGTAQTIQFAVKAPGVGGLYIPVGEAGTLEGTASSGLPVNYAVQTPSICALAQSTAQEQYIWLSFTASPDNGFAVLGGVPQGSGAYLINSVNGLANGQPLGLLPTLTPTNGIPPYQAYVAGGWGFDDILFANGGPLLDTYGLGLTIPADAINLIYASGQGYLYGDTVLANTTGQYLPISNMVAGLVNGLVATGVGICNVTAFQAGNSTYAPAPPVTVSVDVGAIQLP